MGDRATTKRVRLVELPVAVLRALEAGEVAGAGALAGLPLDDYFVSDEARWLWRLRLAEIAADPARARWVAHAAVAEPDGPVVGYAGFHGPPDEAGMVEVGYSVVPAHRRQGHARAMLAALLGRAAAEPAVRTVRASISPENAASLAVVAAFGFARVGEQWDDVDGLEYVFETPVR